MSHDRGWRAACIVTIQILRIHSKMHEVARGVTAMVVGSGALLGFTVVIYRKNGSHDIVRKSMSGSSGQSLKCVTAKCRNLKL